MSPASDRHPHTAPWQSDMTRESVVNMGFTIKLIGGWPRIPVVPDSWILRIPSSKIGSPIACSTGLNEFHISSRESYCDATDPSVDLI